MAPFSPAVQFAPRAGMGKYRLSLSTVPGVRPKVPG